jgi:hypothetical protein
MLTAFVIWGGSLLGWVTWENSSLLVELLWVLCSRPPKALTEFHASSKLINNSPDLFPRLEAGSPYVTLQVSRKVQEKQWQKPGTELIHYKNSIILFIMKQIANDIMKRVMVSSSASHSVGTTFESRLGYSCYDLWCFPWITLPVKFYLTTRRHIPEHSILLMKLLIMHLAVIVPLLQLGQ